MCKLDRNTSDVRKRCSIIANLDLELLDLERGSRVRHQDHADSFTHAREEHEGDT